jgi:hypothetical protein
MVLQFGEVSDIVIPHFHLQDMLSHSSPLGLAYHLLYVEPLLFGCVSSEDCELMQLKTVSESSPRMWKPPFGHLTLHFNQRVMLVHLWQT